MGEPTDRERFQALRVEDDKIVEIAGFTRLRPATRTAKAFAAS